jgi:hypothetical protein
MTLSSNKTSSILAIVFSAFALMASFVASEVRASRSLSDFSAYWTACRLFTSNPFETDSVGAMQQDQAINNRGTLVMRNPPWTALAFFPYAYFRYSVATGLWIVTSVLLVFAAVLFLWRHFGGGDTLPALAVSFTFAPTFILLDLGQITAVLLAGSAVFLFAISSRRDVLAGLALIPFTFKPHISALLLIGVFVWVTMHRRWRVLATFVVALTAMAAACLLLNPSIFRQYAELAREVIQLDRVYTNVAGELYETTELSAARFLPLIGGLGFLIWRFRNMATWDWNNELPLLMAVGVATSFYSYLYDEVLAIPLLLIALLRGNNFVFWLGFIVLNGVVYYHLRVGTLVQCWWTGIAWLALYYAGERFRRRQTLAFGID